MNFKLGLIVCMAASAATFAAEASTNLIVNGDFSAGATGFESAYTYETPSPLALYMETTYTVASNPNDVHPYWVSLPQGDDKLIVNGATGSTPTIWEQKNVGTVSGKSYDFSASAANVCCNASYGNGPNDASHLIFQVSDDGGLTYSTLMSLFTHPPGDAGDFQTVKASFVAGGTTSFRIVDMLSGYSGNDFAIDDISVVASAPEPGTWALMFGGLGLIGGALRLRRAYREERGENDLLAIV